MQTNRHTLQNHIIDAGFLLSPFFVPSVPSSHSQIPQIFSPFLASPSFLMCPFTFKSGLGFFYYDKGAAPSTGCCWHPWQLRPSLPATPSPLLKAFSEPHPTPLATPLSPRIVSGWGPSGPLIRAPLLWLLDMNLFSIFTFRESANGFFSHSFAEIRLTSPNVFSWIQQFKLLLIFSLQW